MDCCHRHAKRIVFQFLCFTFSSLLCCYFVHNNKTQTYIYNGPFLCRSTFKASHFFHYNISFLLLIIEQVNPVYVFSCTSCRLTDCGNSRQVKTHHISWLLYVLAYIMIIAFFVMFYHYYFIPTLSASIHTFERVCTIFFKFILFSFYNQNKIL